MTLRMRSRRTSRCWPSRRAMRTASRCARRWPRTSRWRSIISGISRPRFVPRRGGSRRSTIRPTRITSRSRSGSWVRSSRSTSRLLMAAWKIAPALAAGNCTVLKPASPTPWSILKLAEVIGDIVPPGVLNIVNGPGAEIGKALASNKRIAKVVVHRRDGDRPADHELRRAEPDSLDDGAWREVAEHLLRGCDGGRRRVPRQGDRGSRPVRVQQGRGLHVPVARADPRVDLRRVHGAAAWSGSPRSSRATRSTARR